MTVEHVPPIGMFDRHHRPMDLEFPACKLCNEGSKAADEIVAALSRVYTSRTTEAAMEEWRRKVDHLKNTYPEVVCSMKISRRPTFSWGNHSNQVPPGLLTVSLGEYAVAAITHWGLKFALAMHAKAFDAPAGRNALVKVRIFTNHDEISGRLPRKIFNQLFANPKYLTQGRFTSQGQFSYELISDLERKISFSMCIVREAFAYCALVSESVIDELNFEAPARDPLSMRIAYPFGLPRLSQSEIDRRFAEQLSHF